MAAKTTKKAKTTTKKAKTSKRSKAKDRKWKLSASMMKTFLQCKLQFVKNYLRDIPKPENEVFSLGNAVHHGLELANLFLIGNFRALTEEEIEGFVDEARKFLSKEYVSSMDTFNTVETLVREELRRPPEEEILAAEVHFDMVTPEGVPIAGYIDKVTKVDDHTIRILDYKTSRTSISTSDAGVDEQLSMYDLAGAVLWPEYPNRILELRYLRLEESVTSYRSEIAQYQFRRQIFAVFNAVMEFVNEYKDEKVEEPDGNLNSLCPWCAFKENCPKFQTQVALRGDSRDLTELTDIDIVSTYQNLGMAIKELEMQKDQMKLLMAQRIEGDPENPIVGDTHKIRPLCSPRRSYSLSTLTRLLSADTLLGICSVTTSKVDQLVKTIEDPDLRVAIERSASVKFTSPQYRVVKK